MEGASTTLAPTPFDTLLVVAGATPHQVSAVQRPAGAVLDLATSAFLDFRDGPNGTLMVSQSTVGDDVVGSTCRARQAASAGRAGWRRTAADRSSSRPRRATSAAERPRPMPTCASHPGLPGRREGRTEPDPGANEGVTLARVTEAIVTSARTGRTVAVA